MPGMLRAQLPGALQGGSSPPPPAAAPSTQMGRLFDPKGPQGIYSRGKNIYEGGAMLGPPGAGRPRENAAINTQGGVITPQLMQAIQRRLSGYTERAADKSTERWAP